MDHEHATSSTERTITHSFIEHIWASHCLGHVATIARCDRGGINPCFIVNDTAVIRFNTFTIKGAARFRNERRAYEALRGSGVPVPEVIALDLSRGIAPYDFIITSRMPGGPVIDAWAHLSRAARARVAFAAGEYLATIHTRTFGGFGALGSQRGGGGASAGFSRWYDYVADYLDRYATLARDLNAIGPDERTRMLAALVRHRSLLDLVTRGSLLHSDYHWENILQEHGHVTGVIDFEWALAGDPAWDFIVQDTWEQMCPGSRAHVYGGYTRHRPLAPDHARRVALYQLLLHVETVVDEARKGDAAGISAARDAMYATLSALERVSSNG
jgi:aminoglycoside phosphotransferase (APT) family kinase protein